jgi:hypothetical protein
MCVFVYSRNILDSRPERRILLQLFYLIDLPCKTFCRTFFYQELILIFYPLAFIKVRIFVSIAIDMQLFGRFGSQKYSGHYNLMYLKYLFLFKIYVTMDKPITDKVRM